MLVAFQIRYTQQASDALPISRMYPQKFDICWQTNDTRNFSTALSARFPNYYYMVYIIYTLNISTQFITFHILYLIEITLGFVFDSQNR